MPKNAWMLTDKCGLSNSGRDSAPPFVANGISYGPTPSAMFGNAIEFAGSYYSNARMAVHDAGLFTGSQICVMFWTFANTQGADGPFAELFDETHSAGLRES